MTGDESLAALAGHDLGAQRQLVALLDRYRREGIAGLREHVAATVLDVPRMPTAREFELAALVVEAVLTLAEQRSRAIGRRRAWEDFDRGEQAAEIEREAGGGGA